MARYRIHNLYTGMDWGTWEGDDEAEALAAMHRDVGYQDVRAENGRVVFPDAETARLCGDMGEAWAVTEEEEGKE